MVPHKGGAVCTQALLLQLLHSGTEESRTWVATSVSSAVATVLMTYRLNQQKQK